VGFNRQYKGLFTSSRPVPKVTGIPEVAPSPAGDHMVHRGPQGPGDTEFCGFARGIAGNEIPPGSDPRSSPRIPRFI